MRKKILELLRCPECGSEYKVSFVPAVANADPEDIEYGVVGCKCGEFPIVDGILVTRKYANLSKAVKSIRSAKSQFSLWKTALLLIDESYVRFVMRLSIYVRRYFGKWPWLSFWKVVTFIKNSRYGTYLKFRFSCPSFISAMAFIPVFKEAVPEGGLMLDLGSGVGHFDFLLAKFIGGGKLVCADKVFMNLYLAKNYIVGKDSSFICLDADNLIPFKDKVFSAILSMDAFHYIDKKQQLANEFMRALKEDGALFLVHLHNSLVENMAKGLPVTPSEYAGFFTGLRSWMSAERELVGAVFGKSGIDLSKNAGIEEINASDAVAIFLSRSARFFKSYGSFTSLDASTVRVNEIINPIYMKAGGEYEFRFPSDFYEEEYKHIREYLPARVPAALSSDELRKQLILIDTPRNFMKKNERLYRFKLWR